MGNVQHVLAQLLEPRRHVVALADVRGGHLPPHTVGGCEIWGDAGEIRGDWDLTMISDCVRSEKMYSWSASVALSFPLSASDAADASALPTRTTSPVSPTCLWNNTR